jgi:hypothetical protein
MSPRALICSVAVVLAVTALAPAATGGVIVVALDGSGNTNELGIALDIASAGDVILVKPGTYVDFLSLDPEAFHEIDRPITIVGDGAAPIIGMLRVVDIAAGQEVVLRNLNIYGPLLGDLPFEKLGVRDCAGTVLVEDCTIVGVPGRTPLEPGLAAVDVRNSQGVTFTRCKLSGGAGLSTTPFNPFYVDPSGGGPAVLVDGSRVAFHHCAITGGAGGSDQLGVIHSAPGNDALRIGEAAVVFAAGGSITGGAASNGGAPELPAEAAGGNGAIQSGLFSKLRLIGLAPQGGAGGTLSDASSGPAGQDLIVAVPDSVESFPQAARGTSMPATLRVGEGTTLGISGAPGELGKIMFGLEPAYAPLGGKKGVFNLGGAVVGPLLLGVIPASGTLEVPVNLAPGSLLGLDGLRLELQGLTFGADGLMFGNPTSTIVLAEGL